jgi:membrane fusion protein, multidrug efflux system
MLIYKNYMVMKPLSLISIFLMVLLVSCSPGKGKDSPAPDAKSIKANAVVASETVIDQMLNATGTVMAYEDIELRSEISGKITEILFREGAIVQKGQLLVRLNDKEIKAELQKAVYEKDLLEQKETRQKKLLAINAISREEYDDALKSLNVVKAQISLLTAQLEKTELRAPFSGMAGLRNVSEGAVVTPGTIITTLQNINPLKLDFSVPEKYSRELRNGTKIHFTVEGLDSILSAEIFAIEPRIDPSNRTLKMRAVFKNPQRLVLPGAFANVSYSPGSARNSMMVPSQAIIPDAGGVKVLVLKNGLAENCRVQTGYRDQTHVEIVSGIVPGDTILTSGILQIRPGMPVTVIINH